MDGELDPARTAEVDHLVRTDPQWRRALSRLRALDQMLETVNVPAAPPEMADRIIQSVRRRTRRAHMAWTARIGVGLAAAAAIIIVAIMAFNSTSHHAPDTNDPVNTALADKTSAEDEEFIIQHLDFYRDMEIVENYETLEAIEHLETLQTGT